MVDADIPGINLAGGSASILKVAYPPPPAILIDNFNLIFVRPFIGAGKVSARIS